MISSQAFLHTHLHQQKPSRSLTSTTNSSRTVYKWPEGEETKLPFSTYIMPNHGLAVLSSEILRCQEEAKLNRHLHLLNSVERTPPHDHRSVGVIQTPYAFFYEVIRWNEGPGALRLVHIDVVWRDEGGPIINL
jgi:hypothetical protein